jgi:hypothetical protein
MLLGSALAYALPAFEVERVYYSGPNKQVEVGGSILSCYGGFYKWGKTTSWYESYEYPCD